MPRNRARLFRIFYGRIALVDGSLGLTPQPYLDAIQPGRRVNRYGHDWVVGNLVVDDPEGFVAGRLGYFPEAETEVETDYDVDELRFVERQTDRPHSVSAAFVMDYASGILAFEGHNEIAPSAFVGHLAAVMNDAGLGYFKGFLIREEEDYRSFVERVERVVKVSYRIRRPNPRDREVFRPLREDLDEAGAIEETRVYENEDGLNFELVDSPEDSTANPLVAGVEMVEEGYGTEYRIDGVQNGQPVTYQFTEAASHFRDAVEGVPDDFGAERRTLAEWLTERLDWLAGRARS